MLPPLFAEVAPISAMSKCSLDVKLGREREREREREKKRERERQRERERKRDVRDKIYR